MNTKYQYPGGMTSPVRKCSLDGTERVRYHGLLNFIRLTVTADTPFTIDYTLTERPNYLRLYGGPYNLSIPACPTLFLRKQIHRFCTWETELSFHPSSESTEAGTVLWWNYFTHSTLGIRKLGNGRIIRFQSSEGSVFEQDLDLESDVVLVVECGHRYRFGYRPSTNPQITWIGSVENTAATKAPPVGASYTGKLISDQIAYELY